MLHEYDSSDHRTRAGQRRDLNRDRRLLAADFNHRGFVSRDIEGRPMDILREACDSLGLPYHERMLHSWVRVWERSLFSPVGAFEARRRWGLG